MTDKYEGILYLIFALKQFLRAIGSGMYPTLALFNHSCYNNIYKFNVGKTVVAVASQVQQHLRIQCGKGCCGCCFTGTTTSTSSIWGRLLWLLHHRYNNIYEFNVGKTVVAVASQVQHQLRIQCGKDSCGCCLTGTTTSKVQRGEDSCGCCFTGTITSTNSMWERQLWLLLNRYNNIYKFNVGKAVVTVASQVQQHLRIQCGKDSCGYCLTGTTTSKVQRGEDSCGCCITGTTTSTNSMWGRLLLHRYNNIYKFIVGKTGVAVASMVKCFSYLTIFC